MDIDDLSDEELDDLATELAPRFPTGTHGDRVVLTKRQFIGAATGVLSAGALMALGVDEASAQAAGQVGTESNRVDVFAQNIDTAGTFSVTDLAGGTVTANDSLVDASGTSHAGELADASDVPAVSSTSTASGYEVTINGDTYEYNE